MARAAAPMLRGLRELTSTTRKRSSSGRGDMRDEFTAGVEQRSKDERKRERPPGRPRRELDQETACAGGEGENRLWRGGKQRQPTRAGAPPPFSARWARHGRAHHPP